MIHHIIQKRYREYDKFIRSIENQSFYHIYRDINITWAEKFSKFYTSDVIGEVMVPTSKLRFLASRKSIGTFLSVNGKSIDYKMGLSTSFTKQIDKMHRFMSTGKLKELHVDEDISFIKNCLVQCAKLYGITTYVHLHGALGLKHGFLPLTAYYMCVWDEKQKQKLIGWGLETDRIIVEGYERRYSSWAPLKKENPNQKIQLCSKFNLKYFKPIFLIAPYTLSSYGDGGDAINRKTIRMIQDAILECVDQQIVVKLHPGSKDLQFWRDWHTANALPKNIIILRDFDSRRLILGCDLAIIHHSTMAIDFNQMGKPFFILEDEMPSSVEEFHFDKVATKEEIVDKILNYELDKVNKSKRMLEYEMLQPPSTSAPNILNSRW